MKRMSLGLYGIGMALLLTSCVAKKKYTEAQNRISQLEQTNAECVAKTESLNTNISTLQQTNSTLQGRYDSSMNAYTTRQTKWNDYTTYYDKQKSTADQMHQTLHQQLDDLIGASNIVMNNSKVYITLPEATLFTSGSTSLSSKGKDIINTLASTISQHPDVEVFVATSAVDPATGTLAVSDDENGSNPSSMDNTSNVSTSNNGNYNSTTTKTKSSYNSSTKKTKTSYAAHHPKSTTKYKSEASHKAMRSNYAKAKKPTSSSSSMAVARASTIVSTLRQQGVQKAGIQVTDPVNRNSTSARKYQVIVSPTTDGYYEMMGKNMGTGMK